MNYATLTQCKRFMGISDTVTADDTLIGDLIADADRWVSSSRDGLPYFASRSFDWCDALRLTFNDDLLELITVTNGDSTTIPLTDISQRPLRIYPKYEVAIKTGSIYAFTYSTFPQEAIALLGVWGYHDDYANAWVTSRDAVADVGGINASVTTITVSDADGLAGDLESPRFQAGQLIKMGSGATQEWCEVITVTAGTTNTLTVVRGARGTTAASHAAATSISIYRPQQREAAMQYVKWRYDQKNQRGQFTNELPKDITDLLIPPLGAY